MHEIVSHQAREGERSFDGFLGCVGEAEQQVSDQRHGDLDANGVLGCADEVVDPEGLLDPAEEQLDGPAALVEMGYFLGRSVNLAQARCPGNLPIEQRDELVLGGQMTHMFVLTVIRNMLIKYVPRNALQQIMKCAIVMPHDVAPLPYPNRRKTLGCQ